MPDQSARTVSDSRLPQPAQLPPVTLSLPPDPTEPPTCSRAGHAEAVASPQECLGRYEIHGEIGRGGMGAVLRGRDPVLGRQLALKVLLADRQGDTEARRRFHEEAQNRPPGCAV